MNWDEIDYRGITMLVIAIAVSLAIVIPVIGTIVLNRQLSPGGADVLNSAISTLVGVLAVYVGGKVSGNGTKK